MKTLIETSLFNLFASYINGSEPAAGELPAAYDHFVTCLAELSQDEDLTGQLRRLNYTKIELAFMQQTSNGMTEEHRHILYDVFIGKTLHCWMRKPRWLRRCSATVTRLPDSKRKR